MKWLLSQGGQLQVEIPTSYSQPDIQYTSSSTRTFTVNKKGAWETS